MSKVDTVVDETGKVLWIHRRMQRVKFVTVSGPDGPEEIMMNACRHGRANDEDCSLCAETA